MATMLARNGDGEWIPLAPIERLPDGGLGRLCGRDLAPLLDHPQPLCVAAASPEVDGQPDVVCVSPDGTVTLVVSFFDAAAESALFRLLECAGTLHGMPLDRFRSLCDRIEPGQSLTDWLASQTGGHVDGDVDDAVAESLDAGRFQLIAIVPPDMARLAAPLRYLNRTGTAPTSCFELSVAEAGSVQTAEAIAVDIGATQPADVTRDEHHDDAGPLHQQAQGEQEEEQHEAHEGPSMETAGADGDGAAAEHVEEQLVAAVEEAPAGSRDAVLVPVGQSHDAHHDAGPDDEARHRTDDAPLFLPVDDDGELAHREVYRADADQLMARAAERVGARRAALIGQLTQFCEQAFPEATYETDGETVVLYADLHPAGEDAESSLLAIDSDGYVTLDLAAAETHVAEHLAAGLDRAVGWQAQESSMLCELSIEEHLDDETLVEFFTSVLAEALSGAQDERAEVIDGDFFSADDARPAPMQQDGTHGSRLAVPFELESLSRHDEH